MLRWLAHVELKDDTGLSVVYCRHSTDKTPEEDLVGPL